MKQLILSIALLLAGCHNDTSPPAPYRPIGSEILANSTFAVFTRNPCVGAFGKNALQEQRGDADCATRWVTKWTANASSRVNANKVSSGMQYEMTPVGAESYYVRQYVDNVPWLLGKRFHLSANFTCDENITRVWFYLHFRWNVDREDNPGVTTSNQAGDINNLSIDVQMPATAPYPLDVSAGFVPSFNIDTSAPASCTIHKISLVQLP